MNPIWWCEQHEASGRNVTGCNPGWEFHEYNICRMVQIVFEPEEQHYYIVKSVTP